MYFSICKIKLLILVKTTNITMSHQPSREIMERTSVTFTCVTGEAVPTAEVVWRVGGSHYTSQSQNTRVAGLYNALKRKSQLTLTVNRTLNGVDVECLVKGSKVKQAETLDVKCLFLCICFYHNYKVFKFWHCYLIYFISIPRHKHYVRMYGRI